MLNVRILDAILDRIEEGEDYTNANNNLTDAIFTVVGNNDEKWSKMDDAISTYTYAALDRGVWASADLADDFEQLTAVLHKIIGNRCSAVDNVISAYTQVVYHKGLRVKNELDEVDRQSTVVLREFMASELAG